MEPKTAEVALPASADEEKQQLEAAIALSWEASVEAEKALAAKKEKEKTDKKKKKVALTEEEIIKKALEQSLLEAEMREARLKAEEAELQHVLAMSLAMEVRVTLNFYNLCGARGWFNVSRYRIVRMLGPGSFLRLFLLFMFQ